MQCWLGENLISEWKGSREIGLILMKTVTNFIIKLVSDPSVYTNYFVPFMDISQSYFSICMYLLFQSSWRECCSVKCKLLPCFTQTLLLWQVNGWQNSRSFLKYQLLPQLLLIRHLNGSPKWIAINDIISQIHLLPAL